MTVNTKLDYQNYLTCVEALTESFFDEDGNYAPHIGRIMSVSLFLDFCVEDSGINMEEDNMIDQIFGNEEILMAFENEVQACMESGKPALRFGNAFMDAMAIVEQKKNSLVMRQNASGMTFQSSRQSTNRRSRRSATKTHSV